MDVAAALFAHLSEDAAIEAVVGPRIYPGRSPEGVALPVIVYHRVSTPRVHTKDGYAGLAMARFQVSCFASTYADNQRLAPLVRASLLALTTYDPRISEVVLENEVELFDGATLEHHTAVDAVITHSE